MPSTGLLAFAIHLRGMRPERYASRPARTASFIASAIATWFLRTGDRRIHQHGVGTQFHRQRRIGRRADACVDDQRHPANSRMIRRLFWF
jgi:hypothetical protein